jgi:hypothetical protein
VRTGRGNEKTADPYKLLWLTRSAVVFGLHLAAAAFNSNGQPTTRQAIEVASISGHHFPRISTPTPRYRQNAERETA